jgi:hypothetical protein
MRTCYPANLGFWKILTANFMGKYATWPALNRKNSHFLHAVTQVLVIFCETLWSSFIFCYLSFPFIFAFFMFKWEVVQRVWMCVCVWAARMQKILLLANLFCQLFPPAFCGGDLLKGDNQRGWWSHETLPDRRVAFANADTDLSRLWSWESARVPSGCKAIATGESVRYGGWWTSSRHRCLIAPLIESLRCQESLLVAPRHVCLQFFCRLYGTTLLLLDTLWVRMLVSHKLNWRCFILALKFN